MAWDGARLLQQSSWHGSARGQTLSRGCQPGRRLCNIMKANPGPAELLRVILEEERPHPAGNFQERPSQCPAAPGVAQHGGQEAASPSTSVAVGDGYGLLRQLPAASFTLFPRKNGAFMSRPQPLPRKGSEDAPAGHRQTRRGLFRWDLGFWEHLPRAGPSTMAACLPQSRQLSSAAN